MKLVEKYRPKTFGEIVGQDKVIQAIKVAVKKKEIPHMMFIGKPGTGKTSTAIVIARELYNNNWKNHFIEMNASDERGIDIIRNKIKRLSLSKAELIIFLDEADALTIDAQQALRRIMEKTKNSTFILSVNNEYKIIDPIKSRCAVYIFNPLSNKVVAQKLLEIVRKEGVKVEGDEAKKGFVELVKEARGDLRKAINMLQQIIDENKQISIQTVSALTKPKLVGEALQRALDGDFSGAKELIQEAYLQIRDADQIIRELYDKIENIKDDYIRANLFIKLSQTENRLHHNTNPIIQLVGFIAYAWVLPNLPKECPLLKKR